LPFSGQSVDGIVSCCALKHWPDPVHGLAECIRIAVDGARVIVVEVDGDASAEEFGAFAASTRVPVLMRAAYTRFAMQTVVSVAPTRAILAGYFAEVGMEPRSLDRIPETPFLIAQGVVPERSARPQSAERTAH
jgi:ubiquinone/menaquinone biosynthesis C-methylase UbiE